jgi:hypothetical protein
MSHKGERAETTCPLPTSCRASGREPTRRRAAGLGFGISNVAVKALSGDLDSGPVGLLGPWSVIIVTAAVFAFFASARSLQIGDGVAVIAVTSLAANLSTILAGLAVFGDRLGTDTVDEEQLQRPSAVGHRAHPPLHGLLRADQLGVRLRHVRDPAPGVSLAIFAIRTRRVPFVRSRPSRWLLLSTLAVVAIGFALPFSPFADVLAFRRLLLGLAAVIVAIIPSYLLLLELAKRSFYRREATRPAPEAARPSSHRRVARRAARWSVAVTGERG